MNRKYSNLLPGPRRILFCTPGQWLTALLAGSIVSALALPWYRDVSIWVGLVILLMVTTILHMAYSSSLIVPFPHIAILICGLQYVLAPWLAFYFPAAGFNYTGENLPMIIWGQLPTYLEFAAGATVASALGWAAALIRQKGVLYPKGSFSPWLFVELDVLFWAGLAFGFVSRFVPYESLAFVLLLLANLRYIGVLGRVLAGGQGWQWRLALTLVLEILLATRQGFFHTLLLWSLSCFAVCLYRFRPRKGEVFAFIVLGMLLLPSFQEAKWKLRQKAWGDETAPSEVGRETVGQLMGVTFDWFADLAVGLYRTATLSWDEDFLGDMIARYNQGWIISRVMQHVPDEEPYANGETLLTAAKAALLPRLLDPTKYVAGGRLNMQRFAGIELNTSTSMNLGYVGELYANFGYWGAIGGCFVYAALLGLALRWVARRASRSPLWWAFLPYVGCVAFKAEEGIGEVLNWVVKASLVSSLVFLIFPTIRAALWGTPTVKQNKLANRRPKPGTRRRVLARPDLDAEKIES